MFGKKKENKPKNGRMVYRATGRFARPLSFLLRIIFFVLIGIAAVTLICMLIIAPMRAALEDMTLAPYLRAETGENGNTVYHVSMMEGVRMTVPAERVTVREVKVALYAGLVKLCLGCLILAPLCRFVSILLCNLAEGRFGDKRNPDMICFCALTVLVGSPLFSAVSGYFVYLLQKSFSGPGVMLRYSFRPDWVALVTGILLLLAGFVYGCEAAKLPAPPTLPCKDEGDKGSA